MIVADLLTYIIILKGVREGFAVRSMSLSSRDEV